MPAQEAGMGFTRAMTTTTTNAEVCSVCQEPVQGGFETFSYLRLGTPVIEVAETPDRNFNVCDVCNVTICWRCSVCPESGYCNECFRMVREAQGADHSTEAHEETNLTTMPDPMIIYRNPDDSELSEAQRANLVQNLIKHRQLDIADFQGRIETLTDKLHEVVNDLEGHMSDIDSAITDVLVHAKTLKDAEEAATQFDK